MKLVSSLFGRRCRYCRRRGAALLGPVEPTQAGAFAVNEYKLRYCDNCDVVYLDPLPTETDLRRMYEESAQFNDAHYTDAERVERILDYYSSALLRLGLVRGGMRLLEVGAGLAWVARVCKRIDAGIATVAQDVSREAAGACPWVDRYFVGPLDSLPQRDRFDLISLTHVIEHLVDPPAVLRRLSGLLAPGGNIFVTAPYRPSGWSPDRRMRGWAEYSYLHVPAHITYFSRRWFELFAPPLGLRVASWDATHEDGQAFELVLAKA